MGEFYRQVVERHDIKLFYLINLRFESHAVKIVMKFISRIFDADIYSMMVAMVFLLMITLKADIKSAVILFSSSNLLTHTIKRIVSRKRPFVTLNSTNLAIHAPKDVNSFPSGHTNAAVTLALIIGLFQPLFMPFFAVLAIACGISRVYLGVHYPSDVIIGALIPIVLYTIIV